MSLETKRFPNHIAPTETPSTALAGHYLTVVLTKQAPGIVVLQVRKIIRMQKITGVPDAPAHAKV